jgi:hypothetical protein
VVCEEEKTEEPPQLPVQTSRKVALVAEL